MIPVCVRIPLPNWANYQTAATDLDSNPPSLKNKHYNKDVCFAIVSPAISHHGKESCNLSVTYVQPALSVSFSFVQRGKLGPSARWSKVGCTFLRLEKGNWSKSVLSWSCGAIKKLEMTKISAAFLCCDWLFARVGWSRRSPSLTLSLCLYLSVFVWDKNYFSVLVHWLNHYQ